MKEFLDGNENAESTFAEKLKTFEIEGEIVNKLLKKGNSFFCRKVIRMPVLILVINYFPSSTPSCPQDLGHEVKKVKKLRFISEEIEALDKIIDQNLQCIAQDPPKECVRIETQTGDVSSAEYVDSRVETTDD